MRSDGVELGPVGISLSDQVESIVDLFAVEPLIRRGLEGPLTDPVVTRRPDAGADMAQLGMGRDGVLEAERTERSAVVGDHRDRDDLTRGGVSQAIDELGAVEHGLALREGTFDTGDDVVLVRGGLPVPAELVLRVVVRDAGDPPGPAPSGSRTH
ncbi:MAG: hypothetical protein E7E80_05965 [Cutibacterium avidum]|nr:hypothetical protein [Cutibacterium avidum]MDU3283386.1 hypothetical protein [Cutibacterium avidum]